MAASTTTRPHGSTLLKRKSGKNSFSKKNGKLNIVAMQAPTECLEDAFGYQVCGGGGTGIKPAPILPTQPVTYDTIPAEEVPVQQTPVTDPAPYTPQILPMGTSTPTEQPVSYDPPYTYPETDAANCKQLAIMIADTKNIMMTARMTTEAMDVYNKWLAYAEDRYNSNCKIVTAEPEIPVATTPATAIPEPYSIPPTVDEPPVVKTDQVPTTEPSGSTPTVDSPEIIQTMSGPTSTPYPMGPGGGGGGGSINDTPGSKKRNWFWVVVAATATVGYIFYQKKVAK